MARITCDDCLDYVDNRYDLVHLASKRARQLIEGHNQPLIKVDANQESLGFRKDKETVIALREIADNLITNDNVGDVDEMKDSEGMDLDFNEILSNFEKVDKQVEEEQRLAEEKEADKT